MESCQELHSHSRSALKHQIQLISNQLLPSLLLLPLPSRNSTTSKQEHEEAGNSRVPPSPFPERLLKKTPVSCTESSIFLTHFSLGLHLHLSWSLWSGGLCLGTASCCQSGYGNGDRRTGAAGGSTRESDARTCCILDYSVFLSKHQKPGQGTKQNLRSCSGPGSGYHRGFLLGAKEPPQTADSCWKSLRSKCCK